MIIGTPERDRDHRRRWALAATGFCVLGAVASILSFTSLTWFSVTGPTTYHYFSTSGPREDPDPLSPMPAMNPAHGLLLWLGLAVTVTATVLSLPRSRWSVALRVVAGTAGVLTALRVGDQLLERRSTVRADHSAPHAHVHALSGYWLAIAGLLAMVVAAAVGLNGVVRTPPAEPVRR